MKQPSNQMPLTSSLRVYFLLTWLIVLSLLGGMSHTARAQTPEARAEVGFLAADGALVVQVATPRGQTIEWASLALVEAV